MCDILASIDNTIPNKLMADAYAMADLKKKLFTGVIDTPLGPLNWRLLSAPTVSFIQPSIDQWRNAIDETGRPPAVVPNAFILQAAPIEMGNTQKVLLTFSLKMICRVETVKNDLRMKVYALIKETAGMSPAEIVLYEPFITLVAKNLLPTLQEVSVNPFSQIGSLGITVGGISPAIENNRLGLFGGVNGRPTGSRPTLPEGAFNLLLSGNTTADIFNRYITTMVGETYKTSGSSGFSLGNAKYNAKITLTSARATSTADPLVTNCAVKFTPYASASATLLFIGVDIGYKGHVNPSPVNAKMVLSGSGKQIRATVKDVNKISVVLEPSGGVSQQILSGIAWPLAQTIVSILSPAATDMVKGQSFAFTPFNRINFPLLSKTASLDLNITQLAPYSGMLRAHMNVSTSLS